VAEVAGLRVRRRAGAARMSAHSRMAAGCLWKPATYTQGIECYFRWMLTP